MDKQELLKLLKEAHDEGYDSGYIKGRHAGLSSVAITTNPEYANKAQSWEKFQQRLNFKD